MKRLLPLAAQLWASIAITLSLPSVLVGSGYTTNLMLPNGTTGLSGITSNANGDTFATGLGPGPSIFVSKFDRDGNRVFRAVYNGLITPSAIALSPEGDIYVVGSAHQGLPVRFPLQQFAYSGAFGSGFLMKLSGSDGSILYSTYLGGRNGASLISGIAVDDSGCVYLAGWSHASDFPNTAGLPGIPASDAFLDQHAYVAKLSPSGDRIIYAGAIIASNPYFIVGPRPIVTSVTGAIGVDQDGNAYMVGVTNGQTLPNLSDSPSPRGGQFAVKVNADGASFGYISFLTPPYFQLIGALQVPVFALDRDGNAYFAVNTRTPGLATDGAYQTVMAPQGDALILKIGPDGGPVLWASYLGGSVGNGVGTIALDPDGNVWMSGATGSPEFPGVDFGADGVNFLAALDRSGSSLPYSVRFPGSHIADLMFPGPDRFVHFGGPYGLLSSMVPGEPLSGRIFIAGNRPIPEIAPGQIVSLIGPSIGPASAIGATPDPNGFYPKILSGTEILINGVPAPLLSASRDRIDFVVPVATNTTASALIEIRADDIPVTTLATATADTLVSVLKNPDGYAQALNEDGTPNSPENPAKVGSVVSFWASGVGRYYGPDDDGKVQTVAQPFQCCQVERPAEIGGPRTIFADILFQGGAIGRVSGVVRIDFRLNQDLLGLYGLLVQTNTSGDGVGIYVAR